MTKDEVIKDIADCLHGNGVAGSEAKDMISADAIQEFGIRVCLVRSKGYPTACVENLKLNGSTIQTVADALYACLVKTLANKGN